MTNNHARNQQIRRDFRRMHRLQKQDELNFLQAFAWPITVILAPFIAYFVAFWFYFT